MVYVATVWPKSCSPFAYFFRPSPKLFSFYRSKSYRMFCLRCLVALSFGRDGGGGVREGKGRGEGKGIVVTALNGRLTFACPLHLSKWKLSPCSTVGLEVGGVTICIAW